MSRSNPFTHEEMEIMQRFADSDKRSTVENLSALGLVGRTHNSIRVKVASLRPAEKRPKANVEKRWKAIHAAVKANPNAHVDDIVDIVKTTRAAVYSYAFRHYGSYKNMMRDIHSPKKTELIKKANSCRYYIARERKECGKHTEGKTYCAAHYEATTPLSTRVIMGNVLAVSS